MSQIILVNEQDAPIGVMDKLEAHQKGLLHRAFSIFIFNNKGQMLLQQRAKDKYHSAGLWTNTCCSHPMPGEVTALAAQRRLMEEMGFNTTLQEIFSFTYKTNFDNGLTEHEIDHVFIGNYDDIVQPNPTEVCSVAFKSMDTIRQSINASPHLYTSWFKIAFPKLQSYLTPAGA